MSKLNEKFIPFQRKIENIITDLLTDGNYQDLMGLQDSELCGEISIFLQDEYSTSGYSREEMINNKAKLYELGGTLPDPHYKWDKKKDAEVQGNSH